MYVALYHNLCSAVCSLQIVIAIQLHRNVILRSQGGRYTKETKELLLLPFLTVTTEFPPYDYVPVGGEMETMNWLLMLTFKD